MIKICRPHFYKPASTCMGQLREQWGGHAKANSLLNRLPRTQRALRLRRKDGRGPNRPREDAPLRQRYPEATVGALIVNRKGEILLVKSNKWGDKYTVPGGHIELGERAEDAIRREVREETGLRVKPIALLMIQEAIYPHDYVKREHFIFLDYLCVATSSAVQLDNDELQEYVWIPLRRSLQLRLEPYTRNLIRRYMKWRRVHHSKFKGFRG